MKKRLLSLFLAVALLLVCVPLGAMPVAAGSYNASAAVNYAATYWNDGKGLCAEFVSRCLSAGGVTIPNYAYYSTAKQSYQNNSGTLGAYRNPYTCSAALLLYLSENYTIITNPSASQISVGDVVFMYGGSSGRWKDGHVGIVINTNAGVPIYAAHNKATNSGKFDSDYPCTYVAKMNGSQDFCSDIPEPVLTLRSDKTVYNSSESIRFEWEPAYGAEEYWVYLWKDGVQLFSHNCGGKTSFTQAPSTSGKYTLVIRPGNANGFNDSSPSCSVIVTNKVPDPVTTLRCDKEAYDGSESIHFEWEPAYGAEEYWVYLWKDGVQLFSHNCGGKTSFTQAPSTSGKYTLVIRPGNINGFNDSSASCSFAVGIYSITYNANGGSQAPSAQTKIYGSPITLSSTIPTRAGYNFLGWSTSATATTPTYSAGGSFTANENTTLYAVWQKKHTHTWTAATCTTPKTCTVCKATEGGALGHTWRNATCTAPKTCTVCKATEGGALGHTWRNATCTAPKTCTVCKATEGNALGHTWRNATCTTPKTCTVCKATEGGALGHTWRNATCTTSKTCTVCKATEGGALGHTWRNATCTTPKTCTVCKATEGNALGHNYADGICSNCGHIQSGTVEGTLIKSYSTGSVTFSIFEETGTRYKLVITGSGAIPTWNGLSTYAASIQTIVIREGLTSVPYGAYAGMTALETVVLPSTLTTINGTAFQNCTKLKTINLDEGLTNIGYAAFMNSGLTQVTIPNSLTTMGKWVFANCKKLTSVTFGASKLNAKTIPARTFSGCSALKNVDFGNRLQIIDDYAFNQCGLENLYLPANIKTVDNAAFYKCNSLKTLEIADGGATYLGWASFYSCAALKEMDLGNRLTNISTWVFTTCNSLTDITIPDTVTNIGRCTFKWCTNLKTVKLSDGMTAVKDELFAGCSMLENVTLPANLTAIGAQAFYKCKSLTSLDIPEGVTVAADAFTASGIK